MNINPLQFSGARELVSMMEGGMAATPAVIGKINEAGGSPLVGRGESASFSNFLKDAIHSVNEKMENANLEKTRVLTGETNNLHQAMISVQEASVAFTLMVEVRNKLVESYQEIMRMQV